MIEERGEGAAGLGNPPMVVLPMMVRGEDEGETMWLLMAGVRWCSMLPVTAGRSPERVAAPAAHLFLSLVIFRFCLKMNERGE
jgi:hypothetical protein